MQACILNTCCKRIARNKCSACTLCAATDFICLSVCITGTQKVGVTMNQNAQACEHMSSGCTRQHASARHCSAPLHRCPSLRFLTCVGNKILSGIGACYQKACLRFHTSVRIRVHQDQCDQT